MSETIESVFNKIKGKRAAFIPYFVLGLPDLKKSVELIIECKDYYDIVELGIPFSDPVADGSTIQEATLKALENKITMKEFFKAAKEISDKTGKPVVFMLYFNQVFSYGIKNFMKKASACGVKGIIVPDLLPESDEEFNRYAKRYGINQIFLMTTLSKENRIENLINLTSGFIYLTALTGITGERKDVQKGLEKFAHKVKDKTDKPVCVGFGISEPAHVKQVSGFADGVIVGSAIVRRVLANQDVVSFVKELSDAVVDKVSK